MTSVVRSTVGRLLVATPPLGDEHFDRSVVYMLDHQAGGAMGVVLNRPSPLLAADAGMDIVERWSALLCEPAALFDGGPVETDALLTVAELATEPDEGAWSAVHGRLAMIDLTGAPDDVAPGIRRMRIFRGYAGWGPLQLDGEMAAGAWMVLPAQADDVFATSPGELWREVLRRQGGRTAWIANAPDDVASN